MREINDALIKSHADRRFRSEYDYALFEYYRSAKVLAFLDRAGVQVGELIRITRGGFERLHRAPRGLFRAGQIL